jgi:hypothetical protein
MRKVSLVEIQPDVPGFSPGNPIPKLVGAQGVTIDLLAVHFSVGGVQIEAVAAGHKRNGLLEIRAQFIGSARFARVIAGHGQARAQLLPGILESTHVIPLPAMDGDRHAGELFERLFGIDAQGRG